MQDSTITITIKHDDWLSRMFGYPAYEFVPSHPQAGLDIAQYDALQKESAHSFCYSKVDTTAINTVQSLCKAGFYTVDVNLTFSYSCKHIAEPLRDMDAVSILPGDELDAEPILAIAQTCFIYSRFHLDPHIPNDLANTIKREWIHNYLRKQRGDRLFVAMHNGKPCGFLAAMISTWRDQRCAMIDLIGVKKSHQRTGIGRALVTRFLQHYEKTHDLLLVGTQAANIPSVRFYETLGFKLLTSKYILHAHA